MACVAESLLDELLAEFDRGGTGYYEISLLLVALKEQSLVEIVYHF